MFNQQDESVNAESLEGFLPRLLALRVYLTELWWLVYSPHISSTQDLAFPDFLQTAGYDGE